MEYWVILTVVSILLLSYFIHRKINDSITNFTMRPLTQLEIHERMKYYFDINEKEQEETQLSKYIKENTLRVIVENDVAYWVSDNTFYTAYLVDGDIDQESIRPINTDSMDKEELDKMLSILDHLKGN